MHPTLLKVGSFTIYSYGIMVAIGFALAAIFIYRRAPKFGLDKDKCVDLAVVILISGILGARLLYVLINLPFYLANPLEIIMLSKGGLVWYGGFIAALAAMIIYVRINKLDFWPVMDLVAPYAALAQAFGRIGCFLNGCCYGMKVEHGFPFAVTFPCESEPRLASQLISAGLLFAIFVLLLIWQNRRRFVGEIFLGYCILYSSKRFVMEFLRGDNSKIVLGLTMSQMISIVIFIAASVIFTLKVRQWNKRPTISK
jgi:phosphatidylglycerol:prolipoprotein diacylglycerol transferase